MVVTVYGRWVLIRLVLASSSLARLRLLRGAGFDPEVLVSGVNEDIEQQTQRNRWFLSWPNARPALWRIAAAMHWYSGAIRCSMSTVRKRKAQGR